MNTKYWKKRIVYLVIFSLIITLIPFGNFFAHAEETEQGVKVINDNIEERKEIEVKEERSVNSKTFLNSDGTYTTQISQTPIHYKNDRGNWEDINNTLVETADKNAYENKANDFNVTFNKQVSKGEPTFRVKDGDKTIEVGLVTDEEAVMRKARSITPPISGLVNGDTITYSNILGNADLRYSVGADRVKEDIVFNEKPFNGYPEKFTYKMDLNGLNVQEENGIIYLIDPTTEEKLYYFDAPFMYDSYVPKEYVTTEGFTSIPEEALSYDVSLEHKVIDDQLFIDVIPNQTWLNSSDRVYPVTIDPTIVRLQSTPYAEDTNIRSAFPTQTGGNDLELGAGASSGNIIRSLLKFDLTSIPKDSTILSSSLNLWFTSTNNSEPINVSMYKIDKDWEEDQSSWIYSKKIPSTTWANQGGDYVTSNKLATVNMGTPGNIDDSMKKWNIPINLVQEWLADPSKNYGVLLKSDTENIGYYKKFVSSEQSIAAKYKPLITITYSTNARQGIEGYWDYDTYPLVGGLSYTNLTTSNNIVQYHDLSILGRAGWDFTFTRTYNSKSRESSALGYGWTFTGNEKLYLNIKQTANILNYQDEDGTNHEFTYDGASATYKAPAGRYETIKKTSTDTYTMYATNGEQTTFKIRESSSDTDVKVAYITTQMDRNSNKINYDYNDLNQLIKISTDLGESLSKTMDISYNNQGLIDRITYNDKEYTYRYKNGYLEYVDELKDTDGVKTTTQFVYKNNLLDTIIDPKGRKTTYTYTEGNLTKVQEPQEIDGVKDPDNRPGTAYTLDIPNKKATTTDPEGNLTTYMVNDNFVANKIIDPLGTVSNYELDANYNVLTETETEKGKSIVVQVNSYDLNGNLKTSKDAEGNIETYQYTDFDNVELYIDSNGKQSTYQYDTKGNLKKSILPINNSDVLTTEYVYDSHGDITNLKTSDGIMETINIDYENSVKTSQFNDPNGNITEFKTDLNGNVLNQIDGKGNNTSFKYNLKNELETVKDANLKETRYSYDNNGNIETEVNAQNATTRYQYTGQNLLEKETNQLGFTTTYEYDANGNTTGIKKPEGSKLQYTYDETDRLKSVKLGEDVLWDYIYEPNQLTINGKNNSTSKKITYYDNGLVKSINNLGAMGDTTFTYKGDQYLSGIEYPSFNGWGNLEYIPDDSYNTKEIKRNGETLVSIGYNKSSLPESIDYVNGSSINTKYVNGRLDSETLKTTPNQLLNSFKYEYDKNNNIIGITTNDGKISYKYDTLNQLEEETFSDGTKIIYDYDDVGNRTSKQIIKDGQTKTVISKYNAANQLEQVGDKHYTYSKNGTLLSDGSNTYVYNELDQLVEIKDDSGEIVAQYGYDEEGKREYSKNKNGTTYYQYNGDQVLYEQDSSLKVIKEYTYDDYGKPLTMTYKGSTYYYLTNYRGDVLALTDNNGKVVASYTYDAWGNILSQNGELAEINPYRYAGYRYDEETGLYYLLARYYNASNGVFLSEDPISGQINKPLSLNLYSYVQNNPIMYHDPDGELRRIIIAGGKWILSGGKWVWKKAKGFYKKVTLPTVKYSNSQLQSKFKHAVDFGVKGNYNTANRTKFKNALEKHVKEATEILETTYRGNKVHLYLKGNLGVYTDLKGNFLSGWKLSDGKLAAARRIGFRIK